MAFKVTILNLNVVINKIENILKEDIFKNGLMEKIKNFSILRIQAETRKGNQLPKSTSPGNKKQKPLSKKYVEFRIDLVSAKVPTESHPWWFDPDTVFFSPKKSNLTATGQMLESLSGEIDRTDNSIVVGPTGQRQMNRSNSKEFSTNAELAKDLARRGRIFLGLDRVGVQRIRKLILEEIIKFKKRRGFR